MNIHAKLSKREEDVAEWIGFGYSIKETAWHLGIAFDTVKNVMKKIYSKVGIQKSTELSKFVFCRKFNIPLSECEPARRIISVFFLLLFSYSILIDRGTMVPRRTRTTRTEVRRGRDNI